jgi:hypothetical protein
VVIAVVVAFKLALVAAVAVAWMNSRAGRAVRAAPSPVAGYAKAAGAVLAAEAALLAIVALP